LILVTGGTGFVGHHVVRALADRGERVRVASRRPLESDLLRPGVEARATDLCDGESVASALAGVTTVIHLAAAGLRTDDALREMWAINVEGTRVLARGAAQAGVARFVHMSSAGVYGDSGDGVPLKEADPPAPLTAYQRSKLESEQAVGEELSRSATAWAVLRPYGIYGPGRRKSLQFFRDVQRRRLWFYGPTRVVLHPTYVGDVVQATLSALDRIEATGVHGEVFNVGGERPLAHFDFVRLIAGRLGVRPLRLAVPSWMGAAARPFARLGVPGAERFARRAITYAVDTSKARRVLGFAPQPLESGLDETIRWARSEGLL
jgi:UDP-glucose 4-epimerase